MEALPVRKLSILALMALLAFSASALTIGIAPAEGKLYAPPPDGTGSPIGFLITGCMNSLFEAGYIATDAVVSRTPRGSWGSADYSLAEARDGSVDYMIAFFVEWVASSFHKDAMMPASVDYRLVRVVDGKVLAEGLVPGPTDSADASSHESRTASQVGNSTAESCLKMLSTLAMGGE